MKLTFKSKNSTDTPAVSAGARKKKKRKTKRIIIAVIILSLAAVLILKPGKGRVQISGGDYSLHTVERRDITSTLTGTATVQPKDTYTITSSVDAEISQDFFNENDTVEKDTTLYKLDSSSASSIDRNIERAQKSMDKAKENIEKLNVRSKISGRMTKLYADIGDEINAGSPIADVIDDAYMYVKIPFSIYDVSSFYIGQSASVVTDSNFENISASISDISDNIKTSQSGIKTQDVTLKVKNSGSLSEGAFASAQVGEISGMESGVFEYGVNCKRTVTAEVSGDVVSIVCREGGSVSKNGIILKLENDDLYDTLDDARSELDSASDMRDNYIISAPISGTVVQKNYKAGETISAGRTLAIIYDMSYLKFNLAVDELDIKKISVGQNVEITSDSLSEPLTGKVSAISIVGTTANSSTTYPVTVIIDEPGELLPGMNVEASIVTSSSKGCLTVPLDAVARGNTVLKHISDKTEKLTEEDFESIPVEIGISDNSYTEIISGLSEGDVIGIYKASSPMMFGEGDFYVASDGGDDEISYDVPEDAPSGGPGGGRPGGGPGDGGPGGRGGM